MYADKITHSMKIAIDETTRRRNIQEKYNVENGITPMTIKKQVRDVAHATLPVEDEEVKKVVKNNKKLSKEEKETLIKKLEKEMKEAAKALDFERAAELRDQIVELSGK
jgi:excinuclease ABC subunit B